MHSGDAVPVTPDRTFVLSSQYVPTVHRRAFHEAMALARAMGVPNREKVQAWAAAMKNALRG